jgi:hypothetical protein
MDIVSDAQFHFVVIDTPSTCKMKRKDAHSIITVYDAARASSLAFTANRWALMK